MNNSSSKKGRPSAFTPQRAKIILSAIQKGMSYKQASALAGISYMTFNRWRSDGKEDHAPQALRDFCDHLKIANAKNAHSLVALIFKAAQRNWKAAAWLLERRHPDEWGKHEPTTDDPMESLRKMSDHD